MAAFLEFAAFLGDAWPGREQEAEAFRADLVALRDEMLAEVRQQQASEVFLATLRALVMNGYVQIKDWQPEHVISEKVSTSRSIGRQGQCEPIRAQAPMFDIVTTLALAAVQDHLRRQGKPPLAVSEKALIQQLAGDGKLLDKDNQPIAPESGGDHTWAANLAGATRNVFRIWPAS